MRQGKYQEKNQILLLQKLEVSSIRPNVCLRPQGDISMGIDFNKRLRDRHVNLGLHHLRRNNRRLHPK